MTKNSHINLDNLIYAIKNCNVENTYKMSWLRSIIEFTIESDAKVIDLVFIARTMFKHYWDQTIFFNLQQGQNPYREPIIVQIVKKEINFYKKKYNNFKPIFFLKIQDKINVDTKKIIQVLKRDVIWRFQKDVNLYLIEKNKNQIILKDPLFLKNNSEVILELVNFRWTQILENYNSAPKIANKVRGTEKGEIKRKNLNKFHHLLEIENPKKICFLSNKKIEDDLSIHHVIPWSYLYSDDIWNLVYTKSNKNSKQSNKIPTKKMIDKLIVRNKVLMKKMEEKNLKNKFYYELKNSIEKNLVNQFWIGCKG